MWLALLAGPSRSIGFVSGRAVGNPLKRVCDALETTTEERKIRNLHKCKQQGGNPECMYMREEGEKSQQGHEVQVHLGGVVNKAFGKGVKPEEHHSDCKHST